MLADKMEHYKKEKKMSRNTPASYKKEYPWLNGRIGAGTADLASMSPLLGIKLFFIGMIAISAMFLPGISGSTLLLIFGMYIPMINAVRGLMSMNFACFPALMIFGLGVLTGAVTVVRLIQFCLENYRTQSVYMILGMMIGSFYAIIMGPTTLENALPALNLGSLNLVAVFIGLGLVFGMHFIQCVVKPLALATGI